MIERELMKEVNIQTKGVKGNNKFLLQYYLTKPENNIYGIEIVKIEEDNTSESKHIFDILRGKEKTLSILEMLFRNQVTPATFADVIDDFLGLYI